MNAIRALSPLLSTVLLLALAGDAPRGAEAREPREPRYPRYRKTSTSAEAPARATPPPPELRLDTPAPAPAVPSVRPARTATGTPPSAARVRQAPRPETAERAGGPQEDRRLAELDRLAWVEARLTAHEIFSTIGRREYYRAGLDEGLRAALGERPDGRPYADGSRLGSSDPAAHEDGARVGESAARALAHDRAREQVAEQFFDLSRAPRFLPRYGEPIHTVSGVRLREPSLGELLAEFPIAGFGPIRPRTSVLLAGWDRDATRLGQGSGHAGVFDTAWMDAGAGFARWNRNDARSAVYGRLVNSWDGERFRASFETGFAVALREFYPELGLAAYDDGFGDGWVYGAFVQDELQFRCGYAAGFERAFAGSELSAFHESYPVAYREAYRVAFDDWSNHPKPEIVAVRLIDAGRDEVFEPGEEVLAEYELLNYGGRAAEFRVSLDGDVLALPGHDTVLLPARGGVRSETAVRARIGSAVPSRTRTELRLSVADQVRSVPLRVAYPLQFDRSAVRVDRDDLAGEVHVVVRVRNESVRPTDGALALAVSAWPGYRDVREIEQLAGREAVDLVFTLRGLDPLELMAGDVALEIDVSDGEIVQDELDRHLGDTVRDLDNRDLLVYMARLARDEAVPTRTIDQARQLMLQRLREDWKVAAIGEGNPYKQDLEDRGSRTALGDLVRTSATESSRSRNARVFAGLGRDVRDLVQDLSGAHPLLRRSAKRLAARLP